MGKSVSRQRIGSPMLIYPRAEDIRGEPIPLPIRSITQEYNIPAPPVIDRQDQQPIQAKKANGQRGMLKRIPAMIQRAVRGAKKRLLRKWKSKKKIRVVEESSSGNLPPSKRSDNRVRVIQPMTPRSHLDTQLPPHSIANHASTLPASEDSPAHVVASVSDYFTRGSKWGGNSNSHLVPKYKYFGKSPWHLDSDTKTVNSTVPSSVIKILRGETPPATVIPLNTPAESEDGIVGLDAQIIGIDNDFPSGEASPFLLPKDRTDAGDVALAETSYDFHPPGLQCPSKENLARGTRARESIDTFTTAKTRREKSASGDDPIP